MIHLYYIVFLIYFGGDLNRSKIFFSNIVAKSSKHLVYCLAFAFIKIHFGRVRFKILRAIIIS